MKDTLKENFSKGIFFVILSSLGFALMSFFVSASGDVPFLQKTIFRNGVSLIIALITLIPKAVKNPSVFHFEKGGFKFLLLRAVFGTVGIFGNFYALSHLHVGDAAMLNKMSPFFSILASFLFLGESISPLSLIGLIAAFSGSLLVIKPSLDFSHLLPSLAGFASGMGAGFAYACVRKCHTYKIDSSIIVAFFSLFSTILALPSIIIDFHPMTLIQLIFLLSAGGAAALGQFSITAAYFACPASKISIYEYSNVLFASLLGFIFLGQKPDWMSIAGYAIIISAAVFIFLFNKKKEAENESKPGSDKN